MPGKPRKKPRPGRGATRREFLTGVSTVLTGAAVAGEGLLRLARGEEGRRSKVVGPGKVALILEVNGKRHEVSVEPRATLLEVLREDLRLTGTKSVCEMGQCGACTVLLDGAAHNSCLTLAVEAAGRKITTIEGLSAPGGALHPLQTAFVEKDGMQCGFCTPGQVMAASALLAKNPLPTREEIREGLAGNTCRCGAYTKIFEAVAAAAPKMKKPA
jgi:xanthine dehydrogenase YagT iron-sulfur-binding subunit